MNGGEAAVSVLRARKNLPWQTEKERRIEKALSSDPVDITTLKKLAQTLGGLLNQHLRKKAWPKLVGVSVFHIPPYEGSPLSAHKERPQVLLDVNRCGKRIPHDLPEERRKALQGKLERIILRLLAESPELHYFQGLHDVVLTLLLVVTDESIAYAIMSVLVHCHIRDFLDVDMKRTKVIIGSLSPLLAKEDSQLEKFITKSDCAYYFSLSWLITWYGHVVHSQEDICRLADVFLASHPLLPVYVAATIILSRRAEVLELECEMSAVHGLLSTLPRDLKYEEIIVQALRLFEKHPPKSLVRKHHKLQESSLIKQYPRFLQETQSQKPDHILKHEPSPPKKTVQSATWWVWLVGTSWTRTISRVLTVAGPVLLAIMVYLYLNSAT